jgi:hypothetical protein
MGVAYRIGLATFAAIASVGCTSFDDGSGDGPSSADAITPESVPVSVPAERSSPFCEAISELSARLANDPPDDPNQMIIDTYTELRDDVPSAIAVDFNAILTSLRTGEPIPSIPESATASSETASSPSPDASVIDPGTLDEEGVLPGATPGERIQDYVAFTCLGVGNNPGPQATAPP